MFCYVPSELIRDSWDIAMRAIREIGNPAALAGKDRHYVYYSIWPVTWPKGGGPGSRSDITHLSRKELEKREVFRFRLLDDLTSQKLKAMLRFKIVNMTIADAVELDTNGASIPTEQFIRSHWGRGRSYGSGRGLFPWYQFEFPLTSPPVCYGDNEIGFRVSEKAPRISFDMTVEEVELIVQIR